jgi:hypothetical protein
MGELRRTRGLRRTLTGVVGAGLIVVITAQPAVAGTRVTAVDPAGTGVTGADTASDRDLSVVVADVVGVD